MLIAAAVIGLELACRAGLLSPVSVIPPSAMVAASWAILASGRAGPDIAFSLENVALASLISIGVGFSVVMSVAAKL